jgi:hypothetical protein
MISGFIVICLFFLIALNIHDLTVEFTFKSFLYTFLLLMTLLFFAIGLQYSLF